MVNCPICKEELTEKTDSGWLCNNCDEIVPFQFAEEVRPQCSCGHQH